MDVNSKAIHLIENSLIDLISEYQELDQRDIDIQSDFLSMGLRKRDIIALLDSIEQRIGIKLSPTAFYEFPNIESLARHLIAGSKSPGNERLETADWNEEPEPIAVVGMACRFPGASDVDGYWDLIKQGRDCITEVPPDRWDVEAYFSDDYEAPGKMYARHGGFIDGVDLFDAKLFGISATEAQYIDPQQRILLEVSWEALENSRYPPDKLMKSKTGVYVGLHNSDYLRMGLQDAQKNGSYVASGSSISMAAGRIAYQLGLSGPAIAVDTACSSALTAVHLACNSLRGRECTMAVAGGVNLILTPEFSIGLAKARMLSKSGHCHVFDGAADGYVRAEGCGVVVLKRLADALASGDRILAVIRGSAMNQDGRSNGLTAPNKAAQEEVIKSALKAAGLAPHDVSYVEAHGTGTELGDPIEIEALSAAYCRDRDRPLHVGSVKANIGHCETAAGMAGLIKVILMMEHQTIPENLYFENPNPHINWQEIPIQIPVKTKPWLAAGKTRRAGISAFGFCGTNVHVIMEEAPAKLTTARVDDKKSYLIPVSAASEENVRVVAGRYADYLEHQQQIVLADFCHSAKVSRAALRYRTFAQGTDKENLIRQLRLIQAEGRTIKVKSNRQPPIAFLFTGQETAYPGMAKILYEREPVFRKVIDHCHQIVKGMPSFQNKSLLMAIKGTADAEKHLEDTEYIQPLFFSIQYALVKLFESWGIKPMAVMGHSAGEYAAACCAGIMSWEDGLRLITERGRILKQLSGKGSMIAVFEPAERVQELLAGFAEIGIGVLNGEGNTVVSGARTEMMRFQALLEQRGIPYRILSKVNGFHSALVETIMEEFEDCASQPSYHLPCIDFVSNVTGEFWSGNSCPDGDYWCRHMRSGVAFAAGLKTLVRDGYELMVEIGPSATLTGLVKHNLLAGRAICLPALKSGQSNWTTLHHVLGTLYSHGALIDWEQIEPRIEYGIADMPAYPFERTRYWIGERKGHPIQSDADDGMEDDENNRVSDDGSDEEPIQAAVKQVLGDDEERRAESLKHYLLLQVGHLIGQQLVDDDFGDRLNMVGFDSLMAIRLKNRISTDFGIALPIDIIMDDASIQTLHEYLLPALHQTKEQQPERIPFLPRDTNYFKLSVSQRQLWLLQKMDSSTAAYNLPVGLRLKGNLDREALEAAFNRVIERHEILRTNFTEKDGQAWQCIREPEPAFFTFTDLCMLSEREAEGRARDIACEAAKETFDLEHDALIRIHLIRMNEQQHILLLMLHHIIADGWSILEVLLRELDVIYSAFTEGLEPALADLPIQYADYSDWQQKRVNAIQSEELLAYWSKQLKGAFFDPVLPADYLRPAYTSHIGKRMSYCFSTELLASLETFSRENDTTLFVTLMAGFHALLYRWTRQEDLLVGTTVANRVAAEVEGLIGDFTNHLPIRTRISPRQTVKELLNDVRSTVMEAFHHAECPTEKIVAAVKPVRRDNRNPLYSIAFVMHSFSNCMAGMSLGGLQAELLTPVGQIDNDTSEMDMIIEILQNDHGLMMECEYDTEAFSETTIQHFLAAFETLLLALVTDTDTRVADLPILSAADQELILKKFNNQDVVYPVTDCLHEVFQQQVERGADKVALIFEERNVTYRELDAYGNRLARYLIDNGAGPGTLIGICTERSIEMAAAIIGVLKSGAAYVALDPAYPAERLLMIMEDSDIHTVVVQESTKELMEGVGTIRAITIDTREALTALDYECVRSRCRPEDTAYVLYTSGSTGRPKGTMISHRNVLRLFMATKHWFHFDNSDVWTMFHSFAFDFSVWELWGALLNGGKLIIVPYLVSRSPDLFHRLLLHHQVTVLNQTPSAFRQLVQEDGGHQGRLPLRYIIFGGEALDGNILKPWVDKYGLTAPRLMNMYGITETTVHVTYQPITEASMEGGYHASVGVPIPDLQVYITDEEGRLVPPGALGEICVSGAGVAAGYLNRPELTGQRFIPNRFVAGGGGKIYRSGDLGRFLPNGEIQYNGRMDSQVKLRGFRIELGEIESVLNRHPNVKDSIVNIWGTDGDDQRLVAYIVPKDDEDQGEDPILKDLLKVTQWQSVFNTAYDQTASGDDPTMNLTGWNSSYTGLPIPPAEMAEWVTKTVSVIQGLRPKRVLEIGCGTGMLLFRLAPDCEYYAAVDPSSVALGYLQKQLAMPPWSMPQVELFECPADAVTGFPKQSFDTIIINSVTQYFPSIDYLVRVLENITELVTEGGKIFIGDVRNYELLEEYHTSVQVYRAADDESCKSICSAVRHGMQEEEELLISPDFFIALKQHLPQIKHVEIGLKHGHYENEVSRYRYDAVLWLKGNEPDGSPEPMERKWGQDLFDIQEVCDLLEHERPGSVVISNIPNRRLIESEAMMEQLKEKNEGLFKADIIEQTRQFRNHGCDPEDFWKLSRRYPYAVHVGWDFGGRKDCFRVVIQKHREPSFRCLPEPAIIKQEWSAYANTPSAGTAARELLNQLREHASRRLPEYMVPGTFMIIDKIPLTANGKLDYENLPVPNQSRMGVPTTYEPPRNAVEIIIAKIVGSILGYEEVGIFDNFFEIGGNSLLATQLISHIRANLGVDIKLRDLFISPNVAGLSDIAIMLLAAELDEEILAEIE